MSQQLTLELSDEVYADLQQKANAIGLSIADWIIATVSNQNGNVIKILPAARQEEARQRFRSHAGAISLGYATGVENESIDADLACAISTEMSRSIKKPCNYSIAPAKDL